MKIRTLLTFVLVVFLFSCNNEKKAEEKPILKNYSVEFGMNIKQPDSLQLFYTDHQTPDFDELRSIWLGVKGDSVNQLVKFELPGGVIPTYLRLDFKNREQDVISVENLKVQYGDKIFVQKDSIVGKFFSINPFIKEIDSFKTFKGVLIEDKFDPFIYSNDNLKEKLVNLSK